MKLQISGIVKGLDSRTNKKTGEVFNEVTLLTESSKHKVFETTNVDVTAVNNGLIKMNEKISLLCRVDAWGLANNRPADIRVIAIDVIVDSKIKN